MIPGGARLALRRRRKMLIALGTCAALALSWLGIASASASTRSSLALSLNPDRSNAVRLDGSTVSGKIYVFVKSSEALDQVDFYLDTRWRRNAPDQTATDPPFDFAGSAADGTALPYDTTKLADGSHTIRAVLNWSDGTTTSRRGTLTVANRGATATPTPSMTASTTASPTATNTASPTASSTTSATPTPSQPASSLAPSGPIVIDGKNGTVIENVRISSTTGECITIRNSQNITIRNSDIGPCGRNAVKVQGSSNMKIVDNYIHSEHRPAGCCDTNDGVFASGTTGLLVQGNVVAFNESNIELQSAADVTIIGNYLLNPLGPFPRGQQVQSWSNSRNITVENNHTFSTTDTSKYRFAAGQEDAINFGFTDGITARNNYISGGTSPAGCGLIADQAANNARFVNNVLVRTGQCGIGLANGTSLVIDSNKIFNNTAIPGAGNTALYVWSQYPEPCGPIQVTNNIMYGVKPDGSLSSYWNGGGCGNVTYVGNIGGQEAFNLLSPEAEKLPSPAIPPKPYNCVAPAPYVNQTDWAPC
jgi:Right handed beta helix region